MADFDLDTGTAASAITGANKAPIDQSGEWRAATFDEMAIFFGDAPTLTDPTITNYTETVYAPAAGAAFTVDLANGTVQKFTTNANVTVTLPASVDGKSYVVRINYGGTHTLTWAGAAIKWAGGTVPTPTSVNGKADVFTFFCDGTDILGSVVGQNF